MSTPLIGYYECRATTQRNAEYPIHVLVAFNKDWPENVLKQRGLLGGRRASRPMTEREIEGHSQNVRAQSYKYRTLAGLLEDEARCGASPEFLAELQAAFQHLSPQLAA